MKVILTDKKFGSIILEILDPHYFDAGSIRYVVQIMSDYFIEYNQVPSYDGVILEINKENKNDTSSKMHLDTINLVKNADVENAEQIKDTALDFCRQQVMKRELKVVQSIIDRGDFGAYPQIEDIITKALLVGTLTSDARDIFDNIKETIRPNSRRPIPTGIGRLDSILKGGLGKCELGVLLAPTGVGKTTLLTMFGNAGFMDNANVLQIIFEDNVESVMKKHFTIWTSIHPDDLHMEEEEVIKIATDKRSKSKGKLKILKLPSDSVTISELKSNIRKLKSEGFNPDLILLDYVDCLVPEKAPPGEEWKGEGNIMRHLEAMTTEFDVAMWAATQGNRESIQTELVTTNLMGGSIKKAQIGHVVISVGKTLEQKENKLATMAILKSRIGPDGIVFSNCIFDNEYLIFDADNQDTMFGAEEKEEERKRNRGPEALREARRKQREGVNDIKITLDFDDEKSERVNYEIDNLSNEQPKDENNENQDRVVKPEKTVTTEKTLGEAKADKRKLEADKRAENLRKKARKTKENNNQ